MFRCSDYLDCPIQTTRYNSVLVPVKTETRDCIIVTLEDGCTVACVHLPDTDGLVCSTTEMQTVSLEYI